MFDRSLPGESREERYSRWRSNAITISLLLLLLAAIIVGIWNLWVLIFVASDLSSWAGPR